MTPAPILAAGVLGVGALACAAHWHARTVERRAAARARLDSYRVFVVTGAAGTLGRHLTQALLGVWRGLAVAQRRQ